MGKGVAWCERSRMRKSGNIEDITPLQIGTEPSTGPKSVMNTMVGGYFAAADCCAGAKVGKKRMSATSRGTNFFRGSPTFVIDRIPISGECLVFYLSFMNHRYIRHLRRRRGETLLHFSKVGIVPKDRRLRWSGE